MDSHIDEKGLFAARLSEAIADCDHLPKGRGINTALRNATNVSHTAVKRWLNGETIPSLEHVIVLAKFLEVSALWLLSGQGQKRLQNGSETQELIKVYLSLDIRGRQTVREIAEQQAIYASERNNQ